MAVVNSRLQVDPGMDLISQWCRRLARGDRASALADEFGLTHNQLVARIGRRLKRPQCAHDADLRDLRILTGLARGEAARVLAGRYRVDIGHVNALRHEAGA